MHILILLILFLLTVIVCATEYPDYDSKTCGRPSRRKKVSKDEKGKTLTRLKRSAYFGSDDDDTDDYGEDEENDDNDDTITEKVMGGTDSEIGELPWAVLIRVKQDDGSFGQCGGTLITRRHIITAAHCFRKVEKENHGARCSKSSIIPLNVAADRTEVTVDAVCQSLETKGCTKEMLGTKIKVKRIDDYSKFYNYNCVGGYDIAFIELQEPVPSFLNHICLPHRHNFDQYNQQFALMNSFGFGSDPLHGMKKTEKLQKVELGLPVDEAKCAHAWSNNIRGIICTKEETTKNVCTGDSGGGVTTNYNGQEFLIGIISFGTDCDMLLQNTRANKAQINTDIMFFTATIDKFTGFKRSTLFMP